MSTAVATRTLSPVEEFVDQVLDRDRMEELARSLPAHIKPAMFQRNLLNAVMINPDLMGFSAGLLFREVSKAAALGLYLDPQLGEAYIVVAYNYKTKENEPQLRIGYRGMTKLARQSGDVSIVYAHEVHEKDRFICRLGTEKSLEHEPQMFGDRGPIIGYYAVMKLANGENDFEPMSSDQIHKIRDRSDAYKAYAAKKIKTTPWASDEEEMAKKTVIRRLMKRAPQSPELAEAIRIEDTAEHSDVDRPRLSLVTPKKPPVPPPAMTIEHKPELKTPPAPTTAPVAKGPPKPPEVAPTAAPKFEQIRSQFEEAATAATDGDALSDAWHALVENNPGGFEQFEFEELAAIHDTHERRLEA
jgi:recombination protein RecT